jgi:transcriptional regulator with XRE-family HTH domain
MGQIRNLGLHPEFLSLRHRDTTAYKLTLFGAGLKRLRKALGMNVHDFAKLFGVSHGMIERHEKGQARQTRLQYIRRLRKLEKVYEEELALNAKGIHPQFYKRVPIARPGDLQALEGSRAVGGGLPGDAGGTSFSTEKLAERSPSSALRHPSGEGNQYATGGN